MNINNKSGINNNLIRLSKIIARNVNNPKDWKFCRVVLDNLVKGLTYGMPYNNNFKKRMEEDWANKKKKRNNFKLINLKDETDKRKKKTTKCSEFESAKRLNEKLKEITKDLADKENSFNKLFNDDAFIKEEDDDSD